MSSVGSNPAPSATQEIVWLSHSRRIDVLIENRSKERPQRSCRHDV